jgi:hypothetical protein
MNSVPRRVVAPVPRTSSVDCGIEVGGEIALILDDREVIFPTSRRQ